MIYATEWKAYSCATIYEQTTTSAQCFSPTLGLNCRRREFHQTTPVTSTPQLG